MMRRILYPVVMCLVTFTAFGQAIQQITNDENQYAVCQTLSPEATRAIDSLSIVLGDIYGIGLGQKLRSDKDTDIDIAQAAKVISEIVYRQEDKDFIQGMQLCGTIAAMFQYAKDSWGDFNKQLFFEHMKAQLFTESPIDENTSHVLEKRIADLIDQINPDDEVQNKAVIDSLSMAIGMHFGNATRNDIDLLGADREQVFKGIEYMTYDNSFLAGISLGYAVVDMFENVQERTHMPLNKDLFMEHLTNGLSVESISDEEYLTVSEQIESLMIRAAELSPESIANKKAGEAYMEQLRKDKSFKFTKSGMAYKMLKEGKGKKFTEDDVVNTIYVAKHIDGTVFDSSDGEPMPLSINQVIPGFADMLQLMKPGGKAIVVIPGNLAYGVMGIGDLGPNETLIFEIETVDRQE